MLQQAREKDNRAKVIDALDELVKRNVLMRHKHEERPLKAKKVVDVKYTLYPSTEFVKEQKAANLRVTNNQNKALESGLKIVDN